LQPTEKHDTAVERAIENAEHRALTRGKQSGYAERRHEKTKTAHAKQHQSLPQNHGQIKTPRESCDGYR
jgi:hypothetical protein